MPTSRQLEAFLATARGGSISAAAAYLEVAQPTVSKHLTALERKLGVELFARERGAKAVLTSEGCKLLQEADDILVRHRRMVRRPVAQPAPPEITVLVRHHLFGEIEPWIEDLGVGESGAALRFEIIDYAADYELRVVREPATVALVRHQEASARRAVETNVLAVEPCSLFVAPELAEIAAARAGSPDLPILLPAHKGLADYLKARLVTASFRDDNLVLASPFAASILRQVLDAKGAAVLMDTHARHHLAKGRLVTVGPPIAALNLLFLWNATLGQELAGLVRRKLAREILPRIAEVSATS